MQPWLQNGANLGGLGLAAQRAFLRRFDMAAGHGERRRRRASRSRRRPGGRAARSSPGWLSSTAMTRGWATSVWRPRRANAARRSKAAPRTRPDRAASSINDGRRRGRTIWRKPKPLTAVRSNGCGRIASMASAAADAPPCRWRSASRSRSIPGCRGAGSPWPPPPRRAARARPARQRRRHRSGSSPGSARLPARRRRSGRCRCALPR